MSQAVVPLPNIERRALVSEIPGKNESYTPGVSWAAVIGGAFACAALSLILLALGSGLGFAAVSPWSGTGASALGIGKAAIAWLVLTQIIASAMGGYLAGRLRTKWVNVHTDEVYFRDTANGFLVWAVGLVVTASFLASAGAAVAGRSMQSEQSDVMAAPGTGPALTNSYAYFTDTLLRSSSGGSAGAAGANDAAQRAETERIFAHDLRGGSLPLSDTVYMGQMVASRSGLSQADAENKVIVVFGDAQQAAERSRKALAHLSLWLFVALLGGAFCASYAGTIGGKQRDHVPV